MVEMKRICHKSQYLSILHLSRSNHESALKLYFSFLKRYPEYIAIPTINNNENIEKF